jgi:hypothetical protein
MLFIGIPIRKCYLANPTFGGGKPCADGKVILRKRCILWGATSLWWVCWHSPELLRGFIEEKSMKTYPVPSKAHPSGNITPAAEDKI